jgi:hypothetical protein
MIYIPSFIKIGSGNQKLIQGTQKAWWSHKTTFIFSKWGQEAKTRFTYIVSEGSKLELPQETVKLQGVAILPYWAPGLTGPVGAHTRRGLWKVNPRVSEAARQTFVCVWLMRPPGFASTLRPSPSRHCLKFSWQARDTKCQFCPLRVWGSHGCVPHSRVAFRVTCRSLGLPANLCVYGAL